MSEKKCIQVAIIGPPNVGKSSLLNNILGKKGSIVSPKPHTTRASILGVKNVNDTQIVFLDTPGYMRKGTSVWAECFASTVSSALDESSLAVLIIDANEYLSKSAQLLLKHLASNENLIVCINKTDLVQKGKLYNIISYITEFGYQDKVFTISAETGAGVSDLLDELVSRAEVCEWLFEDEKDCELVKQVYAAECVREKAFYCIHQEVPFSLWTRPTKWYFKSKPDNISLQEIFSKASWKVYVDIIVAQDSHKGIVIGDRGSMIKRIGSAARAELEVLWGAGQLFLNVVVDKNWQRNPQKIEEVCYMTSIAKDTCEYNVELAPESTVVKRS